jgi:hypothetical protein
MTHLTVTTGAIKLLCSIRDTGQHLINERGVAPNAIGLHDTSTHGPSHNWLMEVLKREGLGVAEPVFTFDQILADWMVREVTVVTGGMGMMAGLLPSIVVIAHNMAIHASLRVITQIGEPLPFVKGKGPCPEKYPEEG